MSAPTPSPSSPLLPCPFGCKGDTCSTHKGTRYHKEEVIWWVECESCGMEGPVSTESDAHAKELYNRRAQGVDPGQPAAGLDLEAIEARLAKNHCDCTNCNREDIPSLIAEVRRRAALSARGDQ